MDSGFYAACAALLSSQLRADIRLAAVSTDCRSGMLVRSVES
jgi:hypothetical protein